MGRVTIIVDVEIEFGWKGVGTDPFFGDLGRRDILAFGVVQ